MKITMAVFIFVWVNILVWATAIQCLFFNTIQNAWWWFPAFISCSIFVFAASVLLAIEIATFFCKGKD